MSHPFSFTVFIRLPMTPLQGKNILVTRDASQAGSLKEKLVDLGAGIIVVPTIRIVDPPDWKPFDEAARCLAKTNWVVFTSVNAVNQTKNRLSGLDIDFGHFPDLKIAAVGDQTAKAIQSAGWPIHLLPDRFQAEGLLEKLLGRGISGANIWLPRALQVRPYLVSELERAGADVSPTPVYRNTVPYENRHALREAMNRGNLDWITFTSSSTAINFFKMLDRSFSQGQLPKLASIGSMTTSALKDYSLEPAFTANPQNLDGLARGMLDWEESQLA